MLQIGLIPNWLRCGLSEASGDAVNSLFPASSQPDDLYGTTMRQAGELRAHNERLTRHEQWLFDLDKRGDEAISRITKLEIRLAILVAFFAFLGGMAPQLISLLS